MQYHYINKYISSINNLINIKYSEKKIENMSFVHKIYGIEIILLKKINMNLLYKDGFQLRRKIWNLIVELIISNYSYLLDPIKETD